MPLIESNFGTDKVYDSVCLVYLFIYLFYLSEQAAYSLNVPKSFTLWRETKNC